MNYEATSKHIHMSTRRLRLVADAIRSLAPSDALVRLASLPVASAKPMAKVVASAIANAKQKGSKPETLAFKTIEVMGAGGMKRWHAVSRGQAHTYKKRMTHVRVILTDESNKLIK